MSSHVSNRLHCVFAIKSRRSLLPESLRPTLWAYLVGTAHNLGIQVLAAGGTGDHVHILIALPAMVALSEAMQRLKANSSRWVRNETDQEFQWQEGYGAFSVGIRSTKAVIAYIRNQEEHHRRRDFRAEFEQMLRQHGIELPNVSSSGLDA